MLSCEPAPEAAPTRVELFAATGALSDPWSPTRPGEELVFSRSQLREADGALAAEETRGQMTDAIFQRAARPWSHFSEPHLYNEVIEVVEQPDGSRVQHHRITREPNPRRILPGARATTTPELSEEVQALVREADPATREIDPSTRDTDPATREADPATRVMLSARLADIPEWDIPLIPPEELVGPEAYRSALEERARAFNRREAAIRRARAAVMEDLRTLDARVEDEDRASAWIRFEVPSEAVAALALDPRFTRVVVPHDEARANQVCNQGCWNLKDQQNAAAPLWYLGSAGHPTKLNYDAHHAYGYEGDIANTQWHGTTYGRLLLGVIDLSSLEDESPAFSNRIFGRWNCERYCDGIAFPPSGCLGTWRGRCTELLFGFSDMEGVTCPSSSYCHDAGYHGTSVSGIALANYDHTGSNGLQLGDECYSTPYYSVHCDTWKQRSKGIAPQAGLMYLRLSNTYSQAWESAIDRAISEKVDVLNISVGDGPYDYSNRCKLTLNTSYEDNLENAFDDGIFVVNSSGNYGSPDPTWYEPTECLINSISSKPKVFSVSSVLIDGVLNYNSMDRHVAGSYTGGADVRIDDAPPTTNRPISIVDLLAPSSGHLVTTCNGTNGMTEPIDLFGGSSGAAPHVAGAALLVKHRLLANGHTWVKSPGRLHTVMLAMGDRANHFNPINRMKSGTNNQWGMGRLKLSMFPTYMMRTDSFTTSSTTPLRSRIFTNGMQTNRKFVKCVFLQDEDMSSKSSSDQVSQVRLRLIVVPRPNNQAGQPCPLQPANLDVPIVEDNSQDIKKMVAAMTTDLAAGLWPSQGIAELLNSCVYIEHTPLHVTPQGITTHTFCYQSEVRDDQGI